MAQLQAKKNVRGVTIEVKKKRLSERIKALQFQNLDLDWSNSEKC